MTYFIGFDTNEDASDVSEYFKTAVEHEAGYMAYKLWEKLSDGGFSGYVFIEDYDSILVQFSTDVPMIEIPERFS